MADLKQRKYIRWDAPGVEEVPANETEDIDKVKELFNGIQCYYSQKNGHCFGGTHARTQGILKGKLTVPDDLPQHLKQTELSQQGGEFDFICRYSSEPSDPKLDDRIAQPRGMAMKIFGVKGKMFDAGIDYDTQDIEFNSTPAIDLADAKTTKEIVSLRVKYQHDKEAHDKAIRARDDAELQKAREQVPNKRLECTTFYGQTAYRFGDYVMKYRIVPTSDAQKKRDGDRVDKEPDGILHEWLREYYKDNDAEYDFQVQLLENLEEQPVEYAGTEWDAKKYPWQAVGHMVIPKQESWDEDRNRFWVDNLRVDPWHGLQSLQPLGSPNRLRRLLYPASSAYRRKVNGVKEMHITRPQEMPGY